MAKRWTKQQEDEHRKELVDLYVKKNKAIGEIGKEIGLAETTIYDRLVRLRIPTQRYKKPGFNNSSNLTVKLPRYSPELAEFIGIMLGDGHISPTQVLVHLGNKEQQYCTFIQKLILKLFECHPRAIYTKKGYQVIYVGSTKIVRWLLEMGLMPNKVKGQVDVPAWIWTNKEYMKAFLRGFFDTDGSVYLLASGGMQMSFRNRSENLLKSTRRILETLGFKPSRISSYSIFLTRRDNINKFYSEIRFSNQRHIGRFLSFKDNLTNNAGILEAAKPA
ncbi:MAG: hypothetical protein HYU80_04615 [Candidatus Blackburnbacteria bacterium]|nr:hypothetical protein [Candidatus Blackburnbacteria bacterium]